MCRSKLDSPLGSLGCLQNRQTRRNSCCLNCFRPSEPTLFSQPVKEGVNITETSSEPLLQPSRTLQAVENLIAEREYHIPVFTLSPLSSQLQIRSRAHRLRIETTEIGCVWRNPSSSALLMPASRPIPLLEHFASSRTGGERVIPLLTEPSTKETGPTHRDEIFPESCQLRELLSTHTTNTGGSSEVFFTDMFLLYRWSGCDGLFMAFFAHGTRYVSNHTPPPITHGVKIRCQRGSVALLASEVSMHGLFFAPLT